MGCFTSGGGAAVSPKHEAHVQHFRASPHVDPRCGAPAAGACNRDKYPEKTRAFHVKRRESIQVCSAPHPKAGVLIQSVGHDATAHVTETSENG